jgi:hypothetical protein
MPRFRFNWENIDSDLLRSLADCLPLTGDPASSLKSRYGSRPKEDFIKDTWSILLSHWLKVDSNSCGLLASSLRKKGLGQTDLFDDLAFLQSCRNTQGLRQDALQLFIQRGEQGKSDISISTNVASRHQPQSVQSQGCMNASAVIVTALDRDSLIKFTVSAAAELYGVTEDKIYIDDDGDIVVPCGSAVIFVTVIEAKEIRIFSLLVKQPEECHELYQLLNEINSTLAIGRVFYAADCVYAEHNLRPQFLTKEGLMFAIDMIGELADHLDNKIQDRFGGVTARRERAEDEILV